MEELEDSGLPEPIVQDPQQAAAAAIADQVEPRREMHSFEIDPAQAFQAPAHATPLPALQC